MDGSKRDSNTHSTFFTTKESKDNQNQWAPVPQLLTRSYAVKFEAFSKFAFQLLPKMPKDGSRIPKSMG